MQQLQPRLLQFPSPTTPSLLLLLLLAAQLTLLLLPQPCNAQQDFTTLQVPTFTVGVFYPARQTAPLAAEEATCRAITDRIDRNSARFNSELVTNTNNLINFQNADSRIMTSRMQSRLDALAQAYWNTRGRRMTVFKAWTPYPDSDLTNEPHSLHYEGSMEYM